MNISSKLIFLLTIFVGAVMLLASILFLLQRETGLENALRDELKAHAITLKTALEENYSNGRNAESQRLIDRLRENTKVYSVTLLDEKGNINKSSHPQTKKIFNQPNNLVDVFSRNETIEYSYETGGKKYISIVLPINIGNNQQRALQIVKPMDLIEKEIYYARLNWLAITLFLLAIIFLVVTLVLKQSFSKPIYELLKGADKFGSGDFDYRVKVNKNGDELSILAKNFNQMADNLAEQRESARIEAINRLELERELRHSERLASVGRLAAGVAHEIGTPLNVIDARAAQILKKSDLTENKKVKNLKTIRRQADRITHLIQQLLNLSRPFDLRFQELDLRGHLMETIEHIISDEDNIKVKLDFEENIIIRADKNYLRQVWVNILQNARQAIFKQTDQDGKIIITVNKEVHDNRKYVSISFRDNGEGIDTEDIEKIFDPFYTTKDIGQGTGLGLSVSYRIIEEHDGSFFANNHSERGAIFTVLLPYGEKNK